MYLSLKANPSIGSALCRARTYLGRAKESLRIKAGQAEFRKNWLVGLVAALALSTLIFLLGPESDYDVLLVCLIGTAGFMVWLDRRSVVSALLSFVTRLTEFFRVLDALCPVTITPVTRIAFRSVFLKTFTPPPRLKRLPVFRLWKQVFYRSWFSILTFQ